MMLKWLQDNIPKPLLIKLTAGIIVLSLFFIFWKLHAWYAKPVQLNTNILLKKSAHRLH